MSLALFWELARVPKQVDGAGDREAILKTLIETFGRDPDHPLAPVELSRQHVFLLNDLANRQGGSSIYEVLAELIREHGKIRVWGKH